MSEPQHQYTEEEFDCCLITAHHLRNLGLTPEQNKVCVEASMKYVDRIKDAGLYEWFKENIEIYRHINFVNEFIEHRIVKKLAKTGDYGLVKAYVVFLPLGMTMDFSHKPNGEKSVILDGDVHERTEYPIAKRK